MGQLERVPGSWPIIAQYGKEGAIGFCRPAWWHQAALPIQDEGGALRVAGPLGFPLTAPLYALPASQQSIDDITREQSAKASKLF